MNDRCFRIDFNSKTLDRNKKLHKIFEEATATGIADNMKNPNDNICKR